MSLTVRVAGEAGQGVLTTGHLLVRSFASLGLHVLATRSYMSRIRRGLNWYDVRIGEAPLWGPARRVELLVALTDAAAEVLRDSVADGGLVLHNGAEGDADIQIDIETVAKDTGGSELYANTVAVGAVTALLGYPLAPLESVLSSEFADKGEDVVSNNVACARKGAELVSRQSGRLPVPQPSREPGRVYDGATAVALSAAASGVRFVTAYPMTPATA
ncbi:MAG TPA: 2-oxoacid:acceptor oxidoreductase family protein, partial [Phycisphaerae bacterium]|nr:2-oxoacid:acceptor oxidoreductase family protein [Phycisphaerae bacterium]